MVVGGEGTEKKEKEKTGIIRRLSALRSFFPSLF